MTISMIRYMSLKVFRKKCGEFIYQYMNHVNSNWSNMECQVMCSRVTSCEILRQRYEAGLLRNVVDNELDITQGHSLLTQINFHNHANIMGEREKGTGHKTC